jgi:hypothetical protein
MNMSSSEEKTASEAPSSQGMVAAFDILMFTLLDVSHVYEAWENKIKI